MAQIIPKKITLRLADFNATAFSLMGAFQRQARKEGWTTTEIDAVLNEAKNGNYPHLLATLAAHCEGNGK